MKNLTNQEWKKLTEEDSSCVILDVRTDDEYQEARIPRAVLANVMNPPAFMECVQSLDKNKNCFVYCKSGSRSLQACAVLEYLGFENIYNLTEGISGWDGEMV
ncbi:MAG TPA: rhodanese-like domain-containing protein [Flavobacteriaceae bacterium]|nr:rhodanese-like domain-containing protein [Flavobacteriaceae bacterium]